jgi:hypothetical protein
MYIIPVVGQEHACQSLLVVLAENHSYLNKWFWQSVNYSSFINN